ncbi:MAG TPA: bifunctional UDP-N-acetylglucosamine diphosphorylase/glucosamine-1-phosphate N-acetyltransferase GlmU [Afifellaceae bacterium]|nr:bifunctional UDP-N-acetylglucosamine diphosphorylase/glucosamine-1-phosphate N-acetyltransferase GlmU [Afifellaceae bacterium]
MSERSSVAVILAAGEGTRMRSRLPKVLHPVGGLPMVCHVVRAIEAAGVERLAIVIGPGHDAVAAAVKRRTERASFHVQAERRGTAHAVLAAREALAEGADDVIVAYGDTPFVTAASIGRMRQALADDAVIVVAGMRPADPSGYGRLIVEGDQLVAIREERDASDEERAIRLCNGGIMALAGVHALALLDAIGCDNAKAEFYLTDAVEIANRKGLAVRAIELDEWEAFGVNDRRHLAEAERRFQDECRAAALAHGASLVAPETVFFSYDTVIAADVMIEPNVVFGPEVRLEEGATIRAFSHLEGAVVRAGAVVGPFARIRPGTEVGEGVRVGNFVEVKAATLERGAKVNHLTYIGDAHIGAGANIGAGTITCNYDGYAKHRTDIGEGAFIGSNSSLVAPVTVGAGAYVGSGSVITRNVGADALAVARGEQVEKPGWAKRQRERHGR